MIQDLLSHSQDGMKKALEHFAEEVQSVRTGRAQAALVEGVQVMYYGVNTPLRQVATVQIPDAHSILISPWDPKSLGDIEQGIRESDLGLNPTNDGRVVRIAVPLLTSERRTELVKLLHKMGEETRVALRNIRKSSWDEVQKMHKDGNVTEDERYRAEDQLNKIIDGFNASVEDIVKQKEADILTV